MPDKKGGIAIILGKMNKKDPEMEEENEEMEEDEDEVNWKSMGKQLINALESGEPKKVGDFLKDFYQACNE